MKWGQRYGPEYVNVLRRMVARHLSLEHRFICLTDDATGLHPAVETLPIPSLGLSNNSPERGWNKVVVFQRQLGDLNGVGLFLDLDTIILDSVNCFFEYPGDFCIIRNWPPPLKRTGNSSVFRFVIGEHPEIHSDFVKNSNEITKRFRNDQEYLTRTLWEKGGLRYWPDDWCRSFKRHAIPKGPLRYLKQPKMPDNTKILVFHGVPKPPDAANGYKKSMRRFTRAAPWIADHWR